LTVSVLRHIQAIARPWQGRLSICHKRFSKSQLMFLSTSARKLEGKLENAHRPPGKKQKQTTAQQKLVQRKIIFKYLI